MSQQDEAVQKKGDYVYLSDGHEETRTNRRHLSRKTRSLSQSLDAQSKSNELLFNASDPTDKDTGQNLLNSTVDDFADSQSLEPVRFETDTEKSTSQKNSPEPPVLLQDDDENWLSILDKLDQHDDGIVEQGQVGPLDEPVANVAKSTTPAETISTPDVQQLSDAPKLPIVCQGIDSMTLSNGAGQNQEVDGRFGKNDGTANQNKQVQKILSQEKQVGWFESLFTRKKVKIMLLSKKCSRKLCKKIYDIHRMINLKSGKK